MRLRDRGVLVADSRTIFGKECYTDQRGATLKELGQNSHQRVATNAALPHIVATVPPVKILERLEASHVEVP